MKKLSDEEIQQICNLYKTFGNLREVVKRSLKSTGTVHKYLSLNSLIKSLNIIKSLITDDERLIGVYIGLWLGDGTQYKDRGRNTIKICSNKGDVKLNKFIRTVILKIFNKKTSLFEEKNTKRAYIKLHSKFIFNFIYKYTVFDEKKKTYTVKLRKRANTYTRNFREGCLLGLALSDGYLKERFVFSVSSGGLARNMYDILMGFGYSPRCCLDRRDKYHNKIIYAIYLSPDDSLRLKAHFDQIIRNIGYKYSFQELKYGPAQI